MNPDECAICFEAFTPDSGHSVLGCGHKFHMMCVVRWFQDQEGPSTCPCCRRESGQLDNVPLVEEGDDEEEDESTVDEWSADEDDEDEDVGELRPVWTRQASGQWERTWVVTGGGTAVWDPTANEAEAEDVPEEMEDGAIALQRIWRGHRVRRGVAQREEQEMLAAARILITIKNAVVEEDPVDNWHYQRFLRVD
jgi:hypothetical protein